MIEINNENIIDFILYNYNLESSKQIKEEHISKLEALVVEGKEQKNETLQDVIMFTNLKSIILKNINITNQNFENILQLHKLEKIEFMGCNILCKKELCNPKIKQISLISCNNFSVKNLISNVDTLAIIGGKNIKLKGIENITNLQYLYLQDLKLQDISFITKMPKLKYLNLNGSTIKQKQYDILSNSNIQIEYEKTNYYII